MLSKLESRPLLPETTSSEAKSSDGSPRWGLYLALGFSRVRIRDDRRGELIQLRRPGSPRRLYALHSRASRPKPGGQLVRWRTGSQHVDAGVLTSSVSQVLTLRQRTQTIPGLGDTCKKTCPLSPDKLYCEWNESAAAARRWFLSEGRRDAAGGDVDIPWRRVAAAPRLPRGYLRRRVDAASRE